MSVEEVNKIDMIGIPLDDADTVSLAISDHLVWDSPVEEHLYKLQEKINTYITFIDSGEMYESFPEARGRKLKIIEIYFKYPPPEQAICFLKRVSEILESIDIELQYKVFE